MPELPDVAAMKRYLDATSLHQPIKAVHVRDARILAGISSQPLQDRIQGARFDRSHRHGKHLFVSVDDKGWLVLHFGMSGFLQYWRHPDHSPRHERLRFDLENGCSLAYASQRLLGEVSWADDLDSFLKRAGIGPDVLDREFDVQAFQQVLSGSRAAIKSALMDQKRMAGIGNVYADEICFQAKVHPKTPVNRLDVQSTSRLYTCLQRVLENAVAVDAQAEKLPAGYLLPHRRQATACPRCGKALETIKVSGRSTYLCPVCQEARA